MEHELKNRTIVFTTEDFESTAKMQVLDVADLEGLGKEHFESGLDVRIVDAFQYGHEILIPVIAPDDLELLQHYFSTTIRWAD